MPMAWDWHFLCPNWQFSARKNVAHQLSSDFQLQINQLATSPPLLPLESVGLPYPASPSKSSFHVDEAVPPASSSPVLITILNVGSRAPVPSLLGAFRSSKRVSFFFLQIAQEPACVEPDMMILQHCPWHLRMFYGIKGCFRKRLRIHFLCPYFYHLSMSFEVGLLLSVFFFPLHFPMWRRINISPLERSAWAIPARITVFITLKTKESSGGHFLADSPQSQFCQQGDTELWRRARQEGIADL